MRVNELDLLSVKTNGGTQMNVVSKDLTVALIDQLRNCAVSDCGNCPFARYESSCRDRIIAFAAGELEFLYLKLAKLEREEPK